MHLYIKNMVCNRCVMVVRQELEKLDIESCSVTLGEVETANDLSKEKIEQVGKSLASFGFELLDNAKQQLIEKIKTIIIQQVHYSQEDSRYNFSEILAT